jgi:hypothetical protein
VALDFLDLEEGSELGEDVGFVGLGEDGELRHGEAGGLVGEVLADRGAEGEGLGRGGGFGAHGVGVLG